MGRRTDATGPRGIAMGRRTDAAGPRGIAMGRRTDAAGSARYRDGIGGPTRPASARYRDGTADRRGRPARYRDGTACGRDGPARYRDGTAYGRGRPARYRDGTACGRGRLLRGIAMGRRTDATGPRGIAMGRRTDAAGPRGIAMGRRPVGRHMTAHVVHSRALSVVHEGEARPWLRPGPTVDQPGLPCCRHGRRHSALCRRLRSFSESSPRYLLRFPSVDSPESVRVQLGHVEAPAQYLQRKQRHPRHHGHSRRHDPM